MAEAVITKLVEKGMGRQDAHEVLRKASLDPENMDKHLTEVLKQNTAVTKYLTESEIDEIMKYENYTGLAKEKALEVANRWKN